MRRVYPDLPEIENGTGILNFDIACYFPYRNQDIISIDFGLFSDDFLDPGKWDDVTDRFFLDTKLNHRYPNKNYVTLSKRTGRKVSKTGYPVVDTIEKLNSYRYLIMRFSIWDEVGGFLFPIKIELSEQKPIGNLSFQMGVDDDTITFVNLVSNKNGSELYKSIRNSYSLRPKFGNETILEPLDMVSQFVQDFQIIPFSTEIEVPGQLANDFVL